MWWWTRASTSRSEARRGDLSPARSAGHPSPTGEGFGKSALRAQFPFSRGRRGCRREPAGDEVPGNLLADFLYVVVDPRIDFAE
jgi:hypothetical protein